MNVAFSKVSQVRMQLTFVKTFHDVKDVARFHAVRLAKQLVLCRHAHRHHLSGVQQVERFAFRASPVDDHPDAFFPISDFGGFERGLGTRNIEIAITRDTQVKHNVNDTITHNCFEALRIRIMSRAGFAWEEIAADNGRMMQTSVKSMRTFVGAF